MLSIHIFLGFFFSMSALLLLLFSGGVNQSISTRFENENCEVRWKITKIIRTREIALLWNFGIEPNSFKATGSTTLKYSINYTLHTTSSTSLLDATPLGFNFFSFFFVFLLWVCLISCSFLLSCSCMVQRRGLYGHQSYWTSTSSSWAYKKNENKNVGQRRCDSIYDSGLYHSHFINETKKKKKKKTLT